MDDSLSQRGRSLEEMFFKQRDAELIAKRKKMEQMKNDKEALAEVSGIRNPQVLDALVESGISPGVLASLSLLPLVEVAWADGDLDGKEKKVVLEEAAKSGISQGSTAYDLLDGWLKQRPAPGLRQAWSTYVTGLCDAMGARERDQLKSEVMNRARKVAQAAGGFLHVSKVSPEEEAVLKAMEGAFRSS